MPQFKLEEPIIPLVLEEFISDNLEDEQLLKNSLIRDVSYANQTYYQLIFEKNHFVKIDFSKIRRTFFSTSQLTFSEFNDIKWGHLEFTDCDLDQIQWFNTSLNKLNISSCRFERLAISPDLVKGVIVNYDQAIIFSLTLGIVIDEPRIS